MTDTFSLAALSALLQVVLIDVALAGDNAVVIGLAARALPQRERRIAIASGVVAAAVMRGALALIAVRLLAIVGLTLAGGLLLAWVAWKMYAELRADHGGSQEVASPPSLLSAIWRIIVADLSMSLDNVLAVAGAAREHPLVLLAGLVISVALMGLLADLIARLLSRHRWIAWAGLAVVAFVAVRLIQQGGMEVWHHV